MNVFATADNLRSSIKFFFFDWLNYKYPLLKINFLSLTKYLVSPNAKLQAEFH